MSRLFASSIVLALGACSPLLGLDDVAGDRDHDGVANERDVCPNDYDPQQFDRDGDGLGDACDDCRVLNTTVDLDADGRDDACDACIGDGASGADTDGDGVDDGCDPCVGDVGTTGSDIDADGKDDGCDDCIALGLDRDKDGVDDHCDACLFGPPHDEDGDDIADACDRCPADLEQTLEPPSSDGLGIECDPDPNRIDVRRVFDGFGFDDPGKWQTVPGWYVANDIMIAAEDVGAQRLSYFKLRGDFVYRASVQFTGTGKLGLTLQGQLGGPALPSIECAVTSTGIVSFDAVGMQTALDTAGAIELQVVRTTTPSGPTFECVAIDRHGASVRLSKPGPFVDMRIGVVGEKANGGFDWVDAIDYPTMP